MQASLDYKRREVDILQGVIDPLAMPPLLAL